MKISHKDFERKTPFGINCLNCSECKGFCWAYIEMREVPALILKAEGYRQ